MGYLSTYFDNVSPIEYKVFESKNKELFCLKKQGRNISLNKIEKNGKPRVKVIEKEYYEMHNQDWSYPELRWPKSRILRIYNPTQLYSPTAGFRGGKPGNAYLDIVTLSTKPNNNPDSRVVTVEAVRPDKTISRFKLHLKRHGSQILENNNSKTELKQLINGYFPTTIKKYAGECLKLLKRMKQVI